MKFSFSGNGEDARSRTSDIKLCFATNNNGKIKEVEQLLENYVNILSLKDIGCYDELPETGLTLEDNSKEKAEYVKYKYQVNCFADDTGLEVDALHGEPGVFSARYAGEHANPDDNIDLLLKRLEGVNNRKARFRTVITLCINAKNYQMAGIVEGYIRHQRSGEQGFGYDPVFQPEGYDKTFAEMTLEEKNRISHRAQAFHQLATIIRNYHFD